MGSPFEYFIIFAEMRTGSNFLESNLNAMDGLACLGEAFNPHFIGYPNATNILEVTQNQRDNNPNFLLRAIRKNPEAISGFRYFHDHDPRILDKCIEDARCAKIILTRNPLDSYISWKIARKTGQWKLSDSKAHRDELIVFDSNEFETYVKTQQNFQINILNKLQVTGQTAFYVAYEDLQSVDVMNGLARFFRYNA